MPYRKDICNKIIIDLYFNKGLNRRQVAEKLKCSEDLIAYRIKKLGLKMKPMAENVFAGKKIGVKISSKLKEIFDGEMLGDGCLILSQFGRQASFRESMGHNKLEWGKYLFSILKDNNVPISGNKIYKRKATGLSQNISYSIGTSFIEDLKTIHDRWYIKNTKYDLNLGQSYNNRKFIKIIPSDLKLTPKVLLHWYIGDGAVNNKNGCILHTQCFQEKEINFLRKLLKDFNIKSSFYKDKNVIYIFKSDRIKMLEIMGECPVECYKYKWDISYSRKTQIDSKLT